MNGTWRKAVPLVIVIALAILLFIAKRCSENAGTENDNTGKQKNTTQVSRNRGFDRRISFLEYSEHARCRMDCRHISKAEVEDIMKNGKINYNKSDLQNARCPRYAVEGITKDDQRVRIVFAQCNDFTTVVTVIDLGTDWSCDCPGDDKKFENKK